ncbi:MAG: molybdenum cofactor guanylyltransferase [Actinomycetota bacterium]|nr:molybdenum cofactor guanylyltransferase [Actinomycetota bacterium]
MHRGTVYDAIVLAGGASRRLGGVDKASLEVGGRTLIERVLRALVEADQVVVVGPDRNLPRGVLGTSERPRGGGPVAGLAAGLELVEAPLVAVLACDLPFVTVATLRGLVSELAADRAGRRDGAMLVDGSGQRQPLTAVYRTARLRAALESLVQMSDTPMRDVLQPLTMLDVEAPSGQAWDCDTWADVDRARKRLDEHFVEES